MCLCVCICVYVALTFWYLSASGIAESKEHAEVLKLGINLSSVLSFGEFISDLEVSLLPQYRWKLSRCRTAPLSPLVEVKAGVFRRASVNAVKRRQALPVVPFLGKGCIVSFFFLYGA